MIRKRLYELNSYDFVHPADKRTAIAVEKIPGFETLVSFIQEHAIEQYYNILLKGGSIKLTEKNSPKVLGIFREVAEILGVSKFPDIYLHRSFRYDNRIIGYAHPVVLLATSCLEDISEDRIYFIAGRCLGGIKAGHNKLEFLSDIIGQIDNIIPGADAVQLPLLQWRRKSDLSRDRAGLLACQNYGEAMRMLMLYAGANVGAENTIQIEDFVQQAVEFRNKSSNINQAGKYIMTLFQYSSWVIERAAELFNWYETGEYEKLMIHHT